MATENAGMPRARLACDCQNLSAFVRVVGLFLFGQLYGVGLRVGLPQLPYLSCVATQLLAAALILSIPRRDWSSEAERGRGGLRPEGGEGEQ